MKTPIVVLLVLSAVCAAGQSRRPTQVLDATALKPPTGTHVAIVEFADFQCPARNLIASVAGFIDPPFHLINRARRQVRHVIDKPTNAIVP